MQEDAWDDSLKLVSNPCNSEGTEATSFIKDSGKDIQLELWSNDINSIC